MRVIAVTGSGRLTLRPDETRITMTLTGQDARYEEAVRRSAEDTKKLRTVLMGCGFADGDIRTVSFDIRPEYENYQEGKTYRKQLTGYTFQHRLKVVFPVDNRRLGEILYALGSCGLKPDFDLAYGLADEQAAKDQLLEKAVADAGKKAQALTKAAGVRLLEIQKIDYAWEDPDMEVRPVNRMMVMESVGARYDMDISPEDVDISDTVTVVWEIG